MRSQCSGIIRIVFAALQPFPWLAPNQCFEQCVETHTVRNRHFPKRGRRGHLGVNLGIMRLDPRRFLGVFGGSFGDRVGVILGLLMNFPYVSSIFPFWGLSLGSCGVSSLLVNLNIFVFSFYKIGVTYALTDPSTNKMTEN